MNFYLLAADVILWLHVAFVAFVVLGLLFIFLGKALHWSWVRNIWFRIAHLSSIVIVVVQSWLGIICPLTIWENQLRAKSHDSTYSGSFISHWLQQILYYDFPAWVFIVSYTSFGILVVLSWLWVRPRSFN